MVCFTMFLTSTLIYNKSFEWFVLLANQSYKTCVLYLSRFKFFYNIVKACNI